MIESFDANDVITLITLIKFTLMSHIKRNYFPKEMSKYQLHTLRWMLFQMPGRPLWMARMQFHRISNVWVQAKQYLEAMRGILKSESWVMHPLPLLATI